MEEERDLDQGEREAKGAAIKKLWDLDGMLEISWRQKSRALWLREGDMNTKFFHRSANVRRRVNYINKIRLGQSCTSNLREVKEGIASFFEKLYEGVPFLRPMLDGISFPSINEKLRASLEREFDED